MSKDKIVTARVNSPTFINGVLHYPGETTQANLTELGMERLGQERDVHDDNGKVIGSVPLAPSLEKVGVGDESIQQVEIAPVAPHADNPSMPQGVGPGTVVSGTGRTLSPPGDGAIGDAIQPIAPVAKRGS